MNPLLASEASALYSLINLCIYAGLMPRIFAVGLIPNPPKDVLGDSP